MSRPLISETQCEGYILDELQELRDKQSWLEALLYYVQEQKRAAGKQRGPALGSASVPEEGPQLPGPPYYHRNHHPYATSRTGGAGAGGSGGQRPNPSTHRMHLRRTPSRDTSAQQQPETRPKWH